MKILGLVAKSIGEDLIVNKLDKQYIGGGDNMGLFDLIDKKEDEEEKLKEDFVKNGEQDDYNFEEEDLEEDDYHYEDD